MIESSQQRREVMRSYQVPIHNEYDADLGVVHV
jgi:hypothetical protein